MNAHGKLKKFAKKHGLELKKTKKVKANKTKINSTKKHNELLITIATDLGYIE